MKPVGLGQDIIRRIFAGRPARPLLQQSENIPIGRHLCPVSGQRLVPHVQSFRHSCAVDHQTVRIDKPAIAFPENPAPDPNRLPLILADRQQRPRMHKPAPGPGPVLPLDCRQQGRQVIRRPPVVVIKIGNPRRIRKLAEHTAQHAPILGTAKSAIPLGCGIAGPQHFDDPAGRPSFNSALHQFVSTLSRSTVQTDHDLDPQSALLREDGLECPDDTRSQQARHDDRNIEWSLVWFAGIGENVKSGFHAGDDTARPQTCHVTA